LTSPIVQPDMNGLVSSANNLICSSGTALLISLTYSKNSNGPSADPCGTPQVTAVSSELTPLTETY